MTWVSRSGEAIGAAVAHGTIRDPVLSPDGRRLAFTKSSAERGQHDLWIMDVGRQTSTTIASNLGFQRPIWSPDSQRIVFGADIGPGGNTNLYDIPSTGGSRRATVPETMRAMFTAGWTHDGRQFMWLQSDIAPPRHAIKTMGPTISQRPTSIPASRSRISGSHPTTDGLRGRRASQGDRKSMSSGFRRLVR